MFVYEHILYVLLYLISAWSSRWSRRNCKRFTARLGSRLGPWLLRSCLTHRSSLFLFSTNYMVHWAGTGQSLKSTELFATVQCFGGTGPSSIANEILKKQLNLKYYKWFHSNLPNECDSFWWPISVSLLLVTYITWSKVCERCNWKCSNELCKHHADGL